MASEPGSTTGNTGLGQLRVSHKGRISSDLHHIVEARKLEHDYPRALEVKYKGS